MGIMMPPVSPPMRADHPDKPIQGDDEDYVDYLTRCGEFWTEHPPEPPEGFELVPCEATPRHWPEYRVVDNDFYDAPCSHCQYMALREDHNKLDCQLKHRRWKSWRIIGWLGSKAYALGIVASTGVSYGRCEHCGIGRQYMRPRWLGRRVYILGVRTDHWRCLLKFHHIPGDEIGWGYCAKCLPCPDCGSKTSGHEPTCPVVGT